MSKPTTSIFGSVNSPGFGAYAGNETNLPSFKSISTSNPYIPSLFAAPVSEPPKAGLFGTSPQKIIPSVSASTHHIPTDSPPYQATILPYHLNPRQREQLNSISAMDYYLDWSHEELRHQHLQKHPSDKLPSDPKTFTFAQSHQSSTPTTTIHPVFGKPAAFPNSSTVPGASTSSQSTSTNLPKISPTEFFEKREFGEGTTLAFDPAKLAQWLEKHCHPFTNDSSLKLLVEMATVQPAPTTKQTTNEPNPSLNSSTSAPETSQPSNKSPVQPDPPKSPTDPTTRLNRFDKIALTTPMTFSTTVWEHALSVLIKDSKYTVEVIKDARLVTEYQIGIRFQELMGSASNTPRFVKAVQKFSKQVGEVLDEVFGKLCKLADEEDKLLNE